MPQGLGAGDPLQVDTPAGLMQVTVPDGCSPGSVFEMMVPVAAPPPPSAFQAPPPLESALMSTPPPADAALPREAFAPAADFGEPLPDLEPLQLSLDESKQALPSFEEYKRGPPKPVPTSGSYMSKLPSINPGRSPYDDLPQKDEKPPFESFVFGLTIAGIAFLIFIEIFINSPVFQQVKPFILKLLGNDVD